MSVIKTCGGYDKAKIYVAEFKKLGLSDAVKIFEDELLEYRRANNIFEEGDLITYNDSDFIYKIDTVNRDGLHATTVHEVRRCVIALFGYDNINHATPEEIKSGHRL